MASDPDKDGQSSLEVNTKFGCIYLHHYRSVFIISGVFLYKKCIHTSLSS